MVAKAKANRIFYQGSTEVNVITLAVFVLAFIMALAFSSVLFSEGGDVSVGGNLRVDGKLTVGDRVQSPYSFHQLTSGFTVSGTTSADKVRFVDVGLSKWVQSDAVTVASSGSKLGVQYLQGDSGLIATNVGTDTDLSGAFYTLDDTVTVSDLVYPVVATRLARFEAPYQELVVDFQFSASVQALGIDSELDLNPTWHMKILSGNSRNTDLSLTVFEGSSPLSSLYSAREASGSYTFRISDSLLWTPSSNLPYLWVVMYMTVPQGDGTYFGESVVGAGTVQGVIDRFTIRFQPL